MKRQNFCHAMKSNCTLRLSILVIFIFTLTTSAYSQNVSFNCPEIEDICSIDNINCGADINLLFPQGLTDCNTSSELTYTFTSSTLGDGTIPSSGWTIGNAPIGIHEIIIEGTDACGFSNSCTLIVNIYDCKRPSPTCINGLNVFLYPVNIEVFPDGDPDGDGDIDVATSFAWASDLVASPIYDCSEPIRYSINRQGDEPNMEDNNGIIVTCDDPQFLPIEVYAWDSAFNPYSVQPDGTIGGPNYDFCETYLLISDQFNLCNPEDTITVQGQILTLDDQPIHGVEIRGAWDIPIAITDEDGNYSVTGTEVLLSTITPWYDKDYRNGVDINDLYALPEVILQLNDISPYKTIAADINYSDVISTFDAVMLHRFVLGLDDDFAAPSWRFIDADYVFPSSDPWVQEFPEVVNINNPTADTITANFVGVKIGDMDCSANPDLPAFNAQLVRGLVFNDLNEDCAYQSDEQGFSDWTVKITGELLTIYASTDNDGHYAAQVPVGDYMVELTPPGPIWEACENQIPITVEEGMPIQQNFPIMGLINTPYMEVDIATGIMRRCEESFYVVNYCNLGTIAATDAFIEISFDDFLEVNSSSLPWSSIDGQVYTFDLGSVDPQDCGNFQVQFTISCDALLGQTHCTEAHIFPDSIYVDPLSEWDGASLRVHSVCDADSVRFEIKNKGSDMQNPTQFIVIEDDLIMYTAPIKLEGGSSKFISREANGSTFRIEVEQTQGHPGDSHPTAFVEGCGIDDFGGVSLGFATMFPNNEGDSFVAVDCSENIGAFDPNDKQGFPKGRTNNHLIDADTDIEYLIRFQNTGTDYAHNVIIRDTIDTGLLDLATIRPGSSSHNYEYYLTGEGVVNFIFPDIMLLDSNINEPASHGFVKFKISQNQDNSIGSIIENRAAIYFDFNEPVITNYTLHTIGEPFAQLVMADIEGRVRKPNETAISGVNVELQPGDENRISDSQGAFLFSDQETGQAYDLSFDKDDPVLSGLSTYDLVLFSKHILGIIQLNPYQLLSADVNQSGSLTTLDILEMRRLILMQPNSIDDLEPWLFIDASHIFPDPTQPWIGLETGVHIDNLITNTAIDVIGIKMGDVSGNSDPFTEEDPENREEGKALILSNQFKKLSSNTYQLDIIAEQFEQLTAYQFGIELNNTWAINAVTAVNLPNLDVGNFHINQNQLQTCWYETKALDLAPGALLFSLIVESKDELIVPGIQLSFNASGNSAFDTKGTEYDISLLNGNIDFTSNQLVISPNPGRKNIQLDLHLETAATASVEILNTKGEVLLSLIQHQFLEKGPTSFTIPSKLQAGIYLVRLNTEAEMIVQKLVIY